MRQLRFLESLGSWIALYAIGMSSSALVLRSTAWSTQTLGLSCINFAPVACQNPICRNYHNVKGLELKHIPWPAVWSWARVLLYCIVLKSPFYQAFFLYSDNLTLSLRMEPLAMDWLTHPFPKWDIFHRLSSHNQRIQRLQRLARRNCVGGCFFKVLLCPRWAKSLCFE